MRIKWLGHSAFLIISRDNLRIIMDPFHIGNGLNYPPIDESAEIVTSSHSHADHNHTGSIKGNPRILTGAGSEIVKGLEIRGLPVFHDAASGSKRGNNIIFCFRVEDINLCHLGDLGHLLSPPQILEIGPVDILFIPVGGFFTINAAKAAAISASLKPKVVFPMHYKTPQVDYPISGVDEFLKGKHKVRRLDTGEIEFTRDTLPAETEIVVLKPAC
jgi:L-ascorbate metabolism protein UlaG (beta-lactamase superfamily)